jgi:hypothetical protein
LAKIKDIYKARPERVTRFILYLGYNGTGKTTALKKFIIQYVKAGNRVLIVTPDDMEFATVEEIDIENKKELASFLGIRKTIFLKSYTLEHISDFRDGLLIFDDCRSYFGANTDAQLHELLIRRRQRMIDVVAVGHGFTEVPPKFFTFASEIILFRTNDRIDTRKRYIREFEKVAMAQARVNKKAENDPYYREVIPQI